MEKLENEIGSPEKVHGKGEEVLSQTAPQKPSWTSVVQSKTSLSRHEFSFKEVDGGKAVEIPDDVIEESVPLWEDFLIGKFLAAAPHVAKVHVIVNKIWTLGDKSIKVDVFEVNETTVKFRIRNSSVRARVLRREMWNIANIPTIVSKWSPIQEEQQPDLKTIQLWVTIKNVPHKLFSRKGLRFLSSAVGEAQRLHPDTELCKSFDEAITEVKPI